MTNTVKSEDNIQKPNTTDKESPPFTEAEQTSENDNPKSKCNFDSKKAKIMNCKSLDRPLATNDDLKKESSIHKLKDYFIYSNSLKGFNFNEQRKSLKKCINIKELIKICENNTLGQLKKDNSLKIENMEMDDYNNLIKDKTSKSKRSSLF